MPAAEPCRHLARISEMRAADQELPARRDLLHLARDWDSAIEAARRELTPFDRRYTASASVPIGRGQLHSLDRVPASAQGRKPTARSVARPDDPTRREARDERPMSRAGAHRRGSGPPHRHSRRNSGRTSGETAGSAITPMRLAPVLRRLVAMAGAPEMPRRGGGPATSISCSCIAHMCSNSATHAGHAIGGSTGGSQPSPALTKS